MIQQFNNRHKRGIAYTMLLAFVFNLILPFFASYSLTPAQAGNVDDLAALIGDKILLCTSTGYKWVSLSELRGDEPLPETSEHYECPLCFLHVNKPEVITSDHSILLSVSPIYQVLSLADIPVENHKTIRLLYNRSSRGPPAEISFS